MPELPEVETTRRGVAEHLSGQVVGKMILRERRLRQPIPASLPAAIRGARIIAVRRRAKYLLFDTTAGCAIAHLGMSGSLCIVTDGRAPAKHDHYDWQLSSGLILRYNDPRRFGLLLWTRRDPLRHPLLAKLGPEPLEDGFDGAWLHACSRGRRVAVKNFLMNNATVVGVGNIYASEALHAAGIDPRRAAGRIARSRYERLAREVRRVLARAIEAGGTTLRDFLNADGTPGYFRISLSVYDRAGEPCKTCGAPIRRAVIGQRSSYFCTTCQR